MSNRAVLLLALIAALAVGAVFWLDERPAERRPGEGGERLFEGAPDRARGVEVKRGGARMRAERDDAWGWKLVAPERGEADAREVDAVLRAIADARVRRVVAAKGEPDAGFGLESPEATVGLELDGGASFRLKIGRASPVGTERYVSIGDGRVLLAEIQATPMLDRVPDRFRERRLFPVEGDAIRDIVIERRAERLELRRRDGEWSVVAPFRDLADSNTADSLARALAALEVDRLDDAASSGKPAGAPPEFRLSIGAGSPPRTFRVAIAPESGGPGRHAEREGSSVAGVLPTADFSILERPAAEYRDPRPAPFAPSDLRAVRITHGGTTLSVEKTEGAWTVRGGSGAAEPADSARVDALVDRLRWMKARSIVPAPRAPLASSEWKVELVGTSGLLGTLEIGRIPGPGTHEENADAAPLVPVRSSLRPGIVLEVPADQLRELPGQPKDLAGGRP